MRPFLFPELVPIFRTSLSGGFMAAYKHICYLARLRPRKWKSWRRVEGGIQTEKSYLDSAVALRQMKLHVAAPDRWVENLRLY